jgi:dihydroneopterin aldolase
LEQELADLTSALEEIAERVFSLATRDNEIAWRAIIEIRRSLPSVTEAKVSVAVTSSGSSSPPTGAKSMAKRRRSGP